MEKVAFDRERILWQKHHLSQERKRNQNLCRALYAGVFDAGESAAICENSMYAEYALGNWQIGEKFRELKKLPGRLTMNDLITNMLVIIRNAQAARHESIKAPYSKINFRIAEILKKEGWITDVEVKKRGEKSWIIIKLAYGEDRMPAISGIKRMSKLGKRVYVRTGKIPFVRQGQGISILSTPKGVMSGKEARSQRVGGELLCEVY